MEHKQIESKVLEIRDEMTCIPALAIRMQGANAIQRFWFRRCGYPEDGSSITLMLLSDQKATNDPYSWADLGKGPRTLPPVHDWIIRHFDALSDGDVIDTRVILGEQKEPAQSERFGA